MTALIIAALTLSHLGCIAIGALLRRKKTQALIERNVNVASLAQAVKDTIE